MKRLCKAVFIFAVCLTLAACQHVEPWQRGTLAKSEMSFNPNVLQSKLKNQVYFSKEAASGGNITAGAGCGCN